MGCFSFICKKSNLPIISDSHTGDAVHLFLLKDGKVIEKMQGSYNSYGSVFGCDWAMEWDEVVELMFDEDNQGNGIAAILDEYYNGEIPTTRSEPDPEQGWGDYRNDIPKRIKAIHEIY